jgi:hypothetical protein
MSDDVDPLIKSLSAVGISADWDASKDEATVGGLEKFD